MPSFASAIPEPFCSGDREELLSYLAQLAQFINEHSWLKEHANGFFSRRLWALAPSGWLEALACASLTELNSLPSGAVAAEWPSSLRSFVTRARSLSLALQLPPTCACPCASLRPELAEALRHAVPLKKQHEVEATAQLVAELCATQLAAANAIAVLDWGAGMGHLSRSLAFRHGLDVISLDAVAPLAEAAAQRSAALALRLGACSSTIATVVQKLPFGDALLPSQVGAILAAADEKLPLGTVHAPSFRGRSLLHVGLHACGDLSVGIVRTFVADEAAFGLVSVSCCYNLLTESVEAEGSARCAAESVLLHTARSSEKQQLILQTSQQSAARHEDLPDGPAVGTRSGSDAAGKAGGNVFHAEAVVQPAMPGFPLSEPVKALFPHGIGRERRMLACQSSARWASGSGLTPASIQAQLFRAALDMVAGAPISKGGQPAERRARAMRGAAGEATPQNAPPAEAQAELVEQAWLDFVRETLPAEPQDQLSRTWREQVQPHARNLAGFLALRAALAGPLEALLQLDRLMFVRDSLPPGRSCMLVPLFDAMVSPRCVALVALRS